MEETTITPEPKPDSIVKRNRNYIVLGGVVIFLFILFIGTVVIFTDVFKKESPEPVRTVVEDTAKVSPIPSVEKEEENEIQMVIVKGTNSYLNVRSESSSDSEIVGKLYDGDEVEMIGQEGDWFKINYQDNQGITKAWISKYYSYIQQEFWKEYIDEYYGVSFKYPSNFSVRKDESYIYIVSNSGEDSRYSNIIIFSETQNPHLQYNLHPRDPIVDREILFEDITINGRKYFFDNSFYEEGNPCFGGSEETYTIELKSNLYMSIIRDEGYTSPYGCDINLETLTQDDLIEFSTPDIQLFVATEIAKSIKYID